jgi:hypothetical protein
MILIETFVTTVDSVMTVSDVMMVAWEVVTFFLEITVFSEVDSNSRVIVNPPDFGFNWMVSFSVANRSLIGDSFSLARSFNLSSISFEAISLLRPAIAAMTNAQQTPSTAETKMMFVAVAKDETLGFGMH